MQAWVRDAILPDSRHALSQLHIGSAAALLRPVIYIKGHRRAACWLVRNGRVCVPVGTCTSTPPACHGSPTCHREETAQLPGQLARQPNCQAAGGAQSPQQTRGASFGPVGLPLQPIPRVAADGDLLVTPSPLMIIANSSHARGPFNSAATANPQCSTRAACAGPALLCWTAAFLGHTESRCHLDAHVVAYHFTPAFQYPAAELGCRIPIANLTRACW